MGRCYVCNRILVDTPSNPSEAEKHEEHILHNAIGGRLKSSEILCKECGGAYSKEDEKFVSIFGCFLELIRHKMYSLDHGSKRFKKVDGYYTESEEIAKSGQFAQCIVVSSKEGKVSPTDPYYTVDHTNKRITIYAEKGRAKQFQNVIFRDNPNLNGYSVDICSDLSNQGYTSLFFSEKNSNFNEDFKSGLVKIAVEFALSKGISRETLDDSIEIASNGTAIITDHIPVIPFYPHTSALFIYEIARDIIDVHYPSHYLRLYSEDGKLICYVELFGTFQYYVILCNHYNGQSIDEYYAQRLLRRNNTTDQDIPAYDIRKHIEGQAGKLVQIIQQYINTRIVPDCIDPPSFAQFINGMIEEMGIETIIQEITQNFRWDNFKVKSVYCYDDEEDSIISTVSQCIEQLEDKSNISTYTTIKYIQLNRLCVNNKL